MSPENYPEEWLLPRRHELEPRRWQLPSGEIVGEAVNEEAVRLLRDDPEKYFRLSGRHSQLADSTRRVGVSSIEQP